MKTPIIYILASIGLIVSIAFALNLLTNQSSTISEQETAIYIIDGDTFNTENGETIRLLCVDTPEKAEAGYEDATAFLSSLILGKDVLVERKGLDKYNRTLAWVSLDGELVNKEIVDNGFGSVFEYNNTNCSRVK